MKTFEEWWSEYASRPLSLTNFVDKESARTVYNDVVRACAELADEVDAVYNTDEQMCVAFSKLLTVSKDR